MTLPREKRIEYLKIAFFAPTSDASVWLDGWNTAVHTMETRARARTPIDDYFAAGTAPILEIQAELDPVAPQRFGGVLKSMHGDRVAVVVVPNARHALFPEQVQLRDNTGQIKTNKPIEGNGLAPETVVRPAFSRTKVDSISHMISITPASPAKRICKTHCLRGVVAKTLTVRALDAIKPGPARREIPDGLIGGLYFVVQPSGASSWALRYRNAQRVPRKLTLGRYPAIGLKDARELASRALMAVA